MREKWRVRRGWMKVHAMIDIETDQILGLEVTDESVQDDPLFTPLLGQALEKCGKAHPIRQVLADWGYSRIHGFNAMEKRGIKSGVKTRENAATRSTGSPYRAECVRERMKSGGYREWADETGYGMREKIEGVFSSVKRIFGESVTASSRQGIMREVMMKFNCYNLPVSMSV
ncbi:MAG: Transposase DDE domain protein [Methanoregulaceae archaeon PtaU1.Bin059]|nr:MAG: Transposase DDE domain protein [Methanoregulaceae archaeon PtaB.Bin152]OPY40066.1 MAG: Transposase DDE domain protein [Methanoregulaceae archaeon PtaU1.Bin059]